MPAQDDPIIGSLLLETEFQRYLISQYDVEQLLPPAIKEMRAMFMAGASVSHTMLSQTMMQFMLTQNTLTTELENFVKGVNGDTGTTPASDESDLILPERSPIIIP
jgi:hypothetical protein